MVLEARRKSGGGGGSGGGSSCLACTAPLYLMGWDWKNPKMDALFAIQIIPILVLIACMIMGFHFRWVRRTGKDNLRHEGYRFAAFWGIVAFVLWDVDIALREGEVTTTHLYYLTGIFSSLGWRFSDLLILGVILRTIGESSSPKLARRIPAFNIFALVILALLSAISFGIYTYQISHFIGELDYYPSYSLQKRKDDIDLSYNLVYLACSIAGGVVAAYVFAKERSKATFIMLLAVIPALFLRSLMTAVASAMSVALDDNINVNLKDYYNIGWATNYVYALTTIPVFLGVALIGRMKPSHGEHDQKIRDGQQPEVFYS